MRKLGEKGEKGGGGDLLRVTETYGSILQVLEGPENRICCHLQVLFETYRSILQGLEGPENRICCRLQVLFETLSRLD